MTVREYLHSSNLDPEGLAEILGYKTTSPITKRMDEELPERWAQRLEDLSDLNIAPAPDNNESRITDEQLNDWIDSPGRADDKDPNINETNSGNEVIGPQKIKLKTIQMYVEMIYNGAESLARSRGDEIAAETINRYTPSYVEAWMDYIKYDERILKYLEMLNVGTPLGNLIGIHAVSIGAYTLARITAKEIAANADGRIGESEIEI